MKRLFFLVGLLLAFATPNFAQTKTDTIRFTFGGISSEYRDPSIIINAEPNTTIEISQGNTIIYANSFSTDVLRIPVDEKVFHSGTSYKLYATQGKIVGFQTERGRGLVSSLDVSNCINLENLSCPGSWLGGSLINLNVSGCTALTNLNCDDNPLHNLDVSGLTALTNLSCNGTIEGNHRFLDSLNVSGCTALTSLNCRYNNLTSLDVSECISLTSLDCWNQSNGGAPGPTKDLNVSGCTALTDLNCSGNQLTSLDVSKCTALTDLNCSNNQLTSLDVSKCTALTDLDCSDNELTSLDVSKCTALTDLNCSDNELTNLNLNGITSLNYVNCSDNHIPLSTLYQWSDNISIYSSNQSDSVTLRINQPLDLSTERLFGNSLSTFEVSSDRQSLSADYWKENHFTFRFLKPLQYTLTLYNPAIEEDASFVWHITVIDEEQEGFFAIQVASNNPLWGTATLTGNGVYEEGKTVTITAKAKEGYRFVNWRNGQEVFSTEADTTFTVTKDLDLVAYFEKIPNAMETFTVSLSVNNPDWGIASQIGNGTYDKDEEVSIIAFPETGYRFVNWTKGENTFSTDMIYTFAVTENLELVANFEKVSNNVANEKPQNDNFAVYVQDRTIRLSEARGTIQVFNTAGQCIYNGSSTAIPVSHSGVYIVKVGARSYKAVVR